MNQYRHWEYNDITGFLHTSGWRVGKHINTYNHVKRVLLWVYLECWKSTENGAARATDSWSWGVKMGTGHAETSYLSNRYFYRFWKIPLPTIETQKALCLLSQSVLQLGHGPQCWLMTNEVWRRLGLPWERFSLNNKGDLIGGAWSPALL